MKTDRELLELAANAAGIRYTIEDDEYYKTHKFFGLWLVYDHEPSEYARRYWNPLTDDGDALRLAVKLCLSLRMDSRFIEVWNVMDEHGFIDVEVENDPNAATRRAIVRAAAAIGESMP